MKVEHLAVIHRVDVVASKDHDIFWARLFDRIDVLVHGIRSAAIPLVGDPLLRRNDVEIRSQLALKQRLPGAVQVPIQAERFVLGQDEHLEQPAVHAVGKRKVDDAILAGKWNCGLGPVRGQRLQSSSFAAGQNDRQCALRHAGLRFKFNADEG